MQDIGLWASQAGFLDFPRRGLKEKYTMEVKRVKARKSDGLVEKWEKKVSQFVTKL